MKIRMKRVYETPSPEDGRRILVDRLWPRGLTKEAAALHAWVRDVAPSNALRKWYGHDPDKWQAFRERYFAELDANPAAVDALRTHFTARGAVTFVYSTKESALNNARALIEYLEGHRPADGP